MITYSQWIEDLLYARHWTKPSGYRDERPISYHQDTCYTLLISSLVEVTWDTLGCIGLSSTQEQGAIGSFLEEEKSEVDFEE